MNNTLKLAAAGVALIAVTYGGFRLYKEWRQDMKELKEKAKNKKPGKRGKKEEKKKKKEKDACSKAALQKILSKEVQSITEVRDAIPHMIQMAQQRSPGATPDDLLRFCSVQCNQILQMMKPKTLEEHGVTPQGYQAGLELYQEDEEIQKLIMVREELLTDLRQGGLDLEDPQDIVDFPEDLTVERFLPIFIKVSEKSNETIDEVIEFIESKKDIPPEMLQSLVMEKLAESANKEAKKIFEDNNITEGIYTAAVQRYRTDPQFVAASMKFSLQQQQRAERLQKAIAQASYGSQE